MIIPCNSPARFTRELVLMRLLVQDTTPHLLPRPPLAKRRALLLRPSPAARGVAPKVGCKAAQLSAWNCDSTESRLRPTHLLTKLGDCLGAALFLFPISSSVNQ